MQSNKQTPYLYCSAPLGVGQFFFVGRGIAIKQYNLDYWLNNQYYNGMILYVIKMELFVENRNFFIVERLTFNIFASLFWGVYAPYSVYKL